MKKQTAIITASLALGILGLVFFSYTKITLAEDALINSLFKEALGFLCASSAVIISVICLKMSKRLFAIPEKRGLLLSLPCLLVSLANFPYGALISKTAVISRTDAIWIFAVACLLSALLEELIYRGLIFGLLIELTNGKTIKSVLISSVIFSLSHAVSIFSGADFGSVILQLGYTFLIGIMLCFAYTVTKSIFVPTVLHAVFNTGGRIVGLLGKGSPWDISFWILTILCGALCAIHILLYTRRELLGQQTKTERDL